VIFAITKKGNKTAVRFALQDLVPECLDVCSNARNFYINGSLRSLITTDKGYPGRGNGFLIEGFDDSRVRSRWSL
jgi:hypothetical protein